MLVIGAGPAGMECAIVLGKRGFGRVHLVDANAEPGGAFRWIPRLPGLGQWGRIANWWAIQLDKQANVELISRVRLNADEVREYGAEIVVVATGSRWSEQGVCPFSHEAIPGADACLAHVMTPEQIMRAGKRAKGEGVVVYDCEGDFLGTRLAERLALEGHAVTFVTALDEVSPTSVERYEGALVRRRLHELGIAMHRRTTLTAVHEDRVEARDEFGVPLSSMQRRWCYCRIGSRTTASTGTSSPTRKCWPPKRSRRSTASAVPSRRCRSATPSSTATAWPAKSTVQTPQSPCHTRESRSSLQMRQSDRWNAAAVLERYRSLDSACKKNSKVLTLHGIL